MKSGPSSGSAIVQGLKLGLRPWTGVVPVSRPNFSTDIVGQSVRLHYSSGSVYNATGASRRASESSSGTNRRKPQGWLKPTDYSLDSYRQITSRGMVDFQVRSTISGSLVGGYRTSGLVGSGHLVFGDDGNLFNAAVPDSWFHVPTSLRDKALIEARLKMKRGDVNLGIAFAERNRTARLVAETAEQLTCSLRNLRRGNFRQAGRCLGIGNPGRPRFSTVPQRWLELQYGWKPLLSDVYGSVDALTRRPSDNWIVTGTGLARERNNGVHSMEFTNAGSPAGQVDVSKSGWRGCYVRIDAIPENDLLMSLSSLGITNPALIGWELVPFSFVVDWFLPIGSFLESLDAMLGYGESYTSISAYAEMDAKINRTGRSILRPAQGLKDETMVSVTPGSVRKVRLRRQAMSGVPLPTLPRLRDGRTLTRMANALSLLAQVFGGRG